MRTLDEVMEMLEGRLDRDHLEAYIERHWVRPRRVRKAWYFEEIDIARLELICHLALDIEVNNEGMDVVLSLLDQLYGLRTHMKHLSHALKQQPPEIQSEIMTLMEQFTKTNSAS